MTETGSDSPAGLAFLRARAAGGGIPQGGAEHVWSGAEAGHADPADTQAGAVVEGGEEGVEAALSALGRLDGMPVPEHVGVFEEVLTRLETALTSVDEPVGDTPR